MTVNEWIRAVHENAVKHGWWETERKPGEILALICSEWSEALEEIRKGRTGKYYVKRPGCDDCMDDVDTDLMCDCEEKCPFGYKPEGVVVEIADGIIRILDWFGRIGVRAGEDITLEEMTEGELALLDGRTAEILNWITAKTAGAGIAEDGTIKQEADERMVEALLEAMGAALTTIWQLGYEPEEIIKEKHEYNLGRPYRHGGKVL